jgi:hypothetical protein
MSDNIVTGGPESQPSNAAGGDQVQVPPVATDSIGRDDSTVPAERKLSTGDYLREMTKPRFLASMAREIVFGALDQGANPNNPTRPGRKRHRPKGT